MERNKKLNLSASASPFLVPFFNFYFYCGMTPFKTELDANVDQYNVKTYLLQQVMCGFTHVGQLILVNIYTWEGIKKIKSDITSSTSIFDCASNIGSTFSGIFLLYFLWKQRDKYLLVIEGTRCNFISKRKQKIIHTFVYLLQMSLLIFFGTFHWLLLKEQSNPFIRPELQSASRESSNLTNENLTLIHFDSSSNGSASMNIGPFFVKQEIRTPCQNILLLIIFLYSSQYYLFSQIVFFVLVISLRRTGKQFIKEIRDCCFNEDGIERGIQKYRNLKATTNVIRDVFGNALVGYYVSAVAYYAEAPRVLLGGRGEIEKMVMVYFTISGIIWLLAAEFHNDVRMAMAKWIEFHSDQTSTPYDDRLRIYTISGELSGHDTIALSNKFFPVTYTHLGSMLSLVVTYAIIVLQLHQDHTIKSIN